MQFHGIHAAFKGIRRSRVPDEMRIYATTDPGSCADISDDLLYTSLFDSSVRIPVAHEKRRIAVHPSKKILFQRHLCAGVDI